MLSYYGNRRCSPLHGIFSLSPVERLHRRQYEMFRQPRQIYTREYDSDGEFQLQIHKPYGGFEDYEVTVVRDRNGTAFLKVFSDHDHFLRRYEIDVTGINLELIEWNLNKKHNILTLHVPKILTRPKTERRHRHHKKSRHRHRGRNSNSRNEHATKSESEAETPSEGETSDYTNESIAESRTDSMDSKSDYVAERNGLNHRHLPTMEEIEDEEFARLRKELGGQP